MLTGEGMKSGKWIEFIRVRSSAHALKSAMPGLVAQVREIEESMPEDETVFMNHALYDGDLAVCLVRANGAEPGKTREGFMIAEKLAIFGPIEHAVWLPARGYPSFHSRSNDNEFHTNNRDGA